MYSFRTSDLKYVHKYIFKLQKFYISTFTFDFLCSQNVSGCFRMLEDMVTVKKDSLIIKIKNPKGETTFLKTRYPYGRCVNLGPKMKKTKSLLVSFHVLHEMNSSATGNIQVFFNDPVNGAQMIPTDFEMKGNAVNNPIKSNENKIS